MNRTVVHDTFVIDRSYAAPPARVYNAFADAEVKKQWWDDDDIEKDADHVIDFRVGGRESMSGSVPDGSALFTFDALYQDIVENSRIVYSYEMTMNGQRISVSVATLEFIPDGDGTRLVLTEQGAYLDGLDTSAQREEGTRGLLD
ncbi:MAG TPA: SRPBCC family protein, partial [Jatrophihabitantaceae bacterium]|nr:SRPBCC family protein [Jatrophihabitantaceae bacterium]